jgi:hypothetical protein
MYTSNKPLTIVSSYSFIEMNREEDNHRDARTYTFHHDYAHHCLLRGYAYGHDTQPVVAVLFYSYTTHAYINEFRGPTRGRRRQTCAPFFMSINLSREKSEETHVQHS